MDADSPSAEWGVINIGLRFVKNQTIIVNIFKKEE
jgi:hypothetical protein